MSDENNDTETGGILRKITVATVCGKVGRMGEKDEPKALMRVYGFANGVKRGETAFGPWAGLTGQFEAVNLETGEVAVAPVCILPEPMGSLLVSRAENGEAVQFAYEIGVKYSAKGSAGYEYTTKVIVKESQNDPLAELRQQVKALPAPTSKPGTSAARRR